jgi:hypothetical protein
MDTQTNEKKRIQQMSALFKKLNPEEQKEVIQVLQKRADGAHRILKQKLRSIIGKEMEIVEVSTSADLPYEEGTAKPNERVFEEVVGMWSDRTDIQNREKFRRSLWRKERKR